MMHGQKNIEVCIYVYVICLWVSTEQLICFLDWRLEASREVDVQRVTDDLDRFFVFRKKVYKWFPKYELLLQAVIAAFPV